MKKLHRPHFYCWSEFNPERNIDFHSYLWVREGGNVVFDPLALSDHDARHLASLGPLSHILISNSDHLREAQALALRTGALVWGPAAEQAGFPMICSHWLSEADEALPGLEIFELQGSKTPGELAFVIEDTLITGDLIRAHEAGCLCLLPDAKLVDKALAIESVARLTRLTQIDAVLTGDGWPIFRNGHTVLTELLASLQT